MTKVSPKASENAPAGLRMQFFKQFMTATGITAVDVAAAISCSPLTVRRWFNPSIDDAPLSSVTDAMAAYGYSLNIVLSRGGEEDAEREIFWRRNSKAKFKADRLTFLSEAMMRYDITTKALAEKLELHYTTVDHMFRVNDMSVSRIYRIAASLGMNVYMSVSPVDADVKGDMVSISTHILRPVSDFIRRKERDEE